MCLCTAVIAYYMQETSKTRALLHRLLFTLAIFQGHSVHDCHFGAGRGVGVERAL